MFFGSSADCTDELCSNSAEAPAPSRKLLQSDEGPICVAMAGDCIYEEGISDLDTFCYCIEQPVCDTFLSIADLSICGDKRKKLVKDTNDFEFRPISLSDNKDSQIDGGSPESSKSRYDTYQQEVDDTFASQDHQEIRVDYEHEVEVRQS